MGTSPAIARTPRAIELIGLGIVAFSPWAFGAVEAWATLLIALAVVSMAFLSLWGGSGAGTRRSMASAPGLALLGMAVFGLVQATAWPGAAGPEVTIVSGDSEAPVPPPATSLSRDRESTLQASASLAGAWMLAALIAGVSDVSARRRFGATVAINSVLLSLFAILQGLTWNGHLYWVRPSPQAHAWYAGGPFVCHAHLAAYLNVGLGYALAFLVEPGREREPNARGLRLGWAYASGVIASGIIASQARGGTVAMIVAVVLVFGCIARREAGPRWRALGALALLPPFLLATGSGPAFTRLATVLDAGAKGYVVRAEIWKAGLRAFLDRPVSGSGLGGFATIAAPYFERSHGATFTHAENEPVQLLAEAGLIGLGLAVLGAVGVAVVASRAIRGSQDGDRAMAIGTTFGLITLAIQSLGDFCLHVPAVGLTAAAAVGHLVGATRTLDEGRLRSSPAIGQIFGVAMSALGLLLVVPAWNLARAEAVLAEAGLTSRADAIGSEEGSGVPVDAAKARRGLERALELRPDWADGHLRLGVLLLSEYRARVARWIGEEEPGAGLQPAMADPLWLTGIAESGTVPVAEIAAQEPVRSFLAPAARSFLQAVRCNTTLAVAHVHLAELGFLLEGGPSPREHLSAARTWAGADEGVLRLAALVALQMGDLDEAAACWRRSLVVAPDEWEAVADAVGLAMSPQEIRDQVLTRGTHAVLFAGRLYPMPVEAPARAVLARAALDLLPRDASIDPADRLHAEALAREALGERALARLRLDAALRSRPSQRDWRLLLIGWMRDAHDLRGARTQARIGLQFRPGDPDLRRVLDEVAGDLAKGPTHDLRGGPERAPSAPNP